MMESKLKQVADEDPVVNQKKVGVNEATEGFLDNGETKESAEPQAELNKADYSNEDEENRGEEENEEGGEESV